VGAIGWWIAQALPTVADEADMCLRPHSEDGDFRSLEARVPPTALAVATTRRWRGRRMGRPERDAGFSLIEPIVAAFVMSVVVLAAVNLLVHAAETVSDSRQRQAAAALATQAMEQLRGLPYGTVASGLRNDDLAGDPDISVASGVPRLVLPAAATGGTGVDEQLVVNYGTTTPVPLYPHRAVVSSSTFRSNPTLSVFVTLDPSTSGVYDLTAVVRWTPADGRSRTYVQRSKLFSPVGSGGA
jgi:hypothetical protein